MVKYSLTGTRIFSLRENVPLELAFLFPPSRLFSAMMMENYDFPLRGTFSRNAFVAGVFGVCLLDAQIASDLISIATIFSTDWKSNFGCDFADALSATLWLEIVVIPICDLGI